MEQKIYELLLEILKDIKEVKEELRVSSSMVENQFNEVAERLDRIEAKLKDNSEPIESIEALKYRISNVEKDTARLMRLKGLK